MKYYNKFLYFFGFFFWLSTARAQVISWPNGSEVIEIGDKITIFEDPSTKLNIDQVRAESNKVNFKKSKNVNLSLGYTESVFWLRFTFNNTSGSPLLLSLSQAGLPIAHLYYTHNGSTTEIKSGYTVPVQHKVVRSSFQVFPLLQGSHEYFVKLTTNSEPIPVRIYTTKAFENTSNKQKLIYGFYLGLLFYVMLTNLFFYFSLKNRIYLFYSFVVLIYASYAAAVIDGFVVHFFHKVDLIFWYTTIPTIGVTVQTIYCLYFLEVKKYLPKLYKTTLYIVAYFAIWMLIKFFFRFPIVQPINTVNALVSFFLMGYIGYKVGKNGNRFGYYFAIAYLIYFVLVLFQAVYINFGSPPYLGGLSHVAYATIIEALMLSFLLGRRFEWERDEINNARLAAQKIALEKTKENERIVLQQNQILEEKVANRTQELNNTMQIAENERKKSDALLLNILPAEIADELRQKGTSTAHNYDMATVLFADIKDFTNISTRLSADTMIKELDYIFGAFDKIIDKYNIEKIKVIGDAYMCAGGVPISNTTNAFDVVNAALDMQAFMSQMRQNRAQKGEQQYEIRIGINTGPLVAGIIGIKKFTYDIWGDTVNLASRLETAGQVNKINISENTYTIIKDHYDCEFRGKIEVKGKGQTSMYFVHGPKNNKTNFEKVEHEMLQKLKDGLSPTLYYHGYPHTIEVINNVKLIASHEGITPDDLYLLKMAALFHDMGFLEAYGGHELVGCRMAREYLSKENMPASQIEEICSMIMATKVPQTPSTLLEKIICDADLLYLGTDDFERTGNNLFKELLENNKIKSEREWNELQLNFLKKHHFHTNYVIENYQKKKDQNTEIVRKWLAENP